MKLRYSEIISLEEILNSAKAHGEQSDPEHEIGDLQHALVECWRRLTPKARAEVRVACNIDDWCDWCVECED